jgi:hypothetical protein
MDISGDPTLDAIAATALDATIHTSITNKNNSSFV